ncbi:transforming growth factor beta receptor type 3-like [Saccostrea echinata]|uniref:transforming growth factor beta receptor type 3-like n=1 Tax=Saccostrea echinata TaxID=191078 RepID=UPI002A7EC88B|nr:transforming growth factor beta receptor type 3-like [Saccostrea echinata]
MWPPAVPLVTMGLSLFLLTGNGLAGSQPCKIAFPMNTQYISAYYDTVIQGKGCTSSATTNSSAEVHAINLLNAGPVFRNDMAEVHLLIKSRIEEKAYLEPFIYVLNSRQPVRWKIRTDITLASKKRHLFVIPSYSSIRLVSSGQKKQVRKNTMPQDTAALMSWVKTEYKALTSYTELRRGNQMTLSIGLDKNAASDCVIQENSSQKLNVMAKFEQPELSSGCIVPQTDISRVAYIIEVEQVSRVSNTTAAIEAHLDIRSMSKKRIQKDFWLVLKSPDHVNWRVSTHKLQGYIDIVANSYVDMQRIRMDPVNVRRDEISATNQGLIRWVEDYLGPVAMYTKVNLANKIKLVLPDTASSNSPKLNPTHIDPFSVQGYTKTVIRRVLQTECDGTGRIIVHMIKSVMKIFNLSRKQITLLDDDCIGAVNKKELVFTAMPETCKTLVSHKGDQSLYSNAIVIHKEEVDGGMYDQPSGLGMNDVDEGDEDFGMEGSGQSLMDGTYIDDEDLNQTPDKIEIPIRCTAPRRTEDIVPTTSRPRNISYWDPSSEIHYNIVLYKSSHYTDPLHTFPLALPANSRVYAKASIEADQSLRVVVQNCWISHTHDSPPSLWLIRDGCLKDKNVRRQPGILRSLTQSERFSFKLSNATPYHFLKCQLSICQNWQTKNNKDIPTCNSEDKMCDSESPIAMMKEITLGPLYATNSLPPFEEKEVDSPNSTIIREPHVNIVNPPSESKPSEESKAGGQTVVVEGLDSGTVIGIAFAAFIIGVLLVSALWFIHTHTAPIKHAVASRAVLDGSGESTPMSTAPLQINS